MEETSWKAGEEAEDRDVEGGEEAGRRLPQGPQAAEEHSPPSETRKGQARATEATWGGEGVHRETSGQDPAG